MYKTLFEWVLNLPQWVGGFASWLVSPLGNGLNISPLGLFSIGGSAIIIIILGIHIVRLFI